MKKYGQGCILLTRLLRCVHCSHSPPLLCLFLASPLATSRTKCNLIFFVDRHENAGQSNLQLSGIFPEPFCYRKVSKPRHRVADARRLKDPKRPCNSNGPQMSHGCRRGAQGSIVPNASILELVSSCGQHNSSQASKILQVLSGT